MRKANKTTGWLTVCFIWASFPILLEVFLQRRADIRTQTKRKWKSVCRIYEKNHAINVKAAVVAAFSFTGTGKHHQRLGSHNGGMCKMLTSQISSSNNEHQIYVTDNVAKISTLEQKTCQTILLPAMEIFNVASRLSYVHLSVCFGIAAGYSVLLGLFS